MPFGEDLVLALALAALLVGRGARALHVGPIGFGTRLEGVSLLREPILTLALLIGAQRLVLLVEALPAVEPPPHRVGAAVEHICQPPPHTLPQHALVVEVDQKVDDLRLGLVAVVDVADPQQGFQHGDQVVAQPVFPAAHLVLIGHGSSLLEHELNEAQTLDERRGTIADHGERLFAVVVGQLDHRSVLAEHHDGLPLGEAVQALRVARPHDRVAADAGEQLDLGLDARQIAVNVHDAVGRGAFEHREHVERLVRLRHDLRERRTPHVTVLAVALVQGTLLEALVAQDPHAFAHYESGAVDVGVMQVEEDPLDRTLGREAPAVGRSRSLASQKPTDTRRTRRSRCRSDDIKHLSLS